MGFADLSRTGPLVIELPAGPTAGGVSDFWQRGITDMGQTGPDKGAGGRYLFVGPEQEEPEPAADDHYVTRSQTNNVWIALRLLTTDEAERRADPRRRRPSRRSDRSGKRLPQAIQ